MSYDFLSYKIPNIPNHILPPLLLALVMAIVALLLIFEGRKVVKALAFLIVGLIGLSIGGALGGQYLSSLGATTGTILGALMGFFAGGLIGLLLVALGIALVVGYGAYLLTLDLISNSIVAIVVGIVFFIIAVAFYNKILTFVTAVAGAFLLYDALILFGLGPFFSLVLAVLAFGVGIWYDFDRRRKSVVQPRPQTST